MPHPPTLQRGSPGSFRDGATGAEDLCASCGDRSKCDLPRLEGGVWHCESYCETARDGTAAWGGQLAQAPDGERPRPAPPRPPGKAGTMTEVTHIVDKHRGERGELIAILEEIQARYSFLPEDALRSVAERTGRSLTDIYGVATFYKWFSLKPRGKHLLTCCLGTACHVRGAPRVADELARQLGVHPGDTTADGQFTLETQNCLGGCALGPIVVADGHYFSNVTTSAVAGLVERTRAGLDRIDVATDQRVFPLEVSCARCNRTLMDSGQHLDGHPAIRVTIAFGDKHGWLLLSSLYGSYTIESQYPIPVEEVVNFFCPHCHAELRGAGDCLMCGAPMVPMIVRGGGVLQICARRGCRAHRLDLNGAVS
jgi:NADH-quinone oxidoreductase subunit E